MPLVECPKCRYRSPVRTVNLSSYNQCLRCTSRFIPMPARPRRRGTMLAAAGAIIASMAIGVAWVYLRTP